MCGIVGIWRKNGKNSALLQQTEHAVDKLRHRGPDDSGVWSNNCGVVFGHTRLSILDLSQQAHQPMLSNDGRYALVFNGEIYNYKAIQDELISLGHTFRGSGDSEVVLASLQQWGPKAVQRFIGMFSIALWDEAAATLILIRDRIGVKPLYYGWDGTTLCFASEVKALQEFEHWSPEIELAAAGEYFQYGYISSPRSIYKNIFKLKPGHMLQLKNNSAPIIEAYWSLISHLGQPIEASESEIEEELESLMIDAFQHRMVSDVPVGIFLSGGVDSSLVATLLAHNNSENIKTFTIGFKENSHDESIWAKKVADHLGTDHTGYILSSNEALSLAKNWGALFDEPFSDSSGIPTLLVSKMASKDVKVVLSADGGDELFSGYNVYSSALARWRTLQKIPKWMQHTGSIASKVIGTSKSMARNHAKLVKKAEHFQRLFENPTSANCYDIDISLFSPSDIRILLGDYSTVRCPSDVYPGNFAEQICLWDLHHYLPDDILTKVDRTTMAAGIEGREPLLDHRIIEYAFRLPLKMRRGELGTKHILKKILYKHVPRELVERPKQGFSIPMERWLKTDLEPLVRYHLESNKIKSDGLLNYKYVNQVVDDFYHGENYLARKVWHILAFQMWREEWL